MYLDTSTLDSSFRVKHEVVYYMVYANSGNLKCFECGDVGHKRVACLHRAAGTLPGPVEGGVGTRAAPAGPPAKPAQPSYAGVLINAAVAVTKLAAEIEGLGGKETVVSSEVAQLCAQLHLCHCTTWHLHAVPSKRGK